MSIDKKLIAQIRRYAEEHYDEDGWDYLVESFEDSEIQEEIGNSKTLRGALRKLRWVLKLLNERRDEIQSTAECPAVWAYYNQRENLV